MSVEKEAKKKRTRRNISKAILGTIAVAGTLVLAVSAPNAVQLLSYFPGMKKGKRLYNEGRAFMRLLNRGDIEILKEGGRTKIRLTQKGQSRYLRSLQRPGQSMVKKPLRWDRRWRMIIYDIPEKRRKIRKNVSTLLRSQGFYKLQSSVWIHPYDCEDLIVLLKADLKIGKDLLYAVIEHIEYDAPIREFFGLPKS